MAKLILAFYVLATSLGLIFLKLGTEDSLPVRFINNKIQFNLNFYAVTGIFLYVLSFVLYIYLISKNDLGYIIPLTTALVYVVIFVSSFFIFHEVFTATKIVGISLILGGLIFLNIQR